MKVTICSKIDNEGNVKHTVIEKAQIIWIELDNHDKEMLMNNFMIRNDRNDKLTSILTDKITII